MRINTGGTTNNTQAHKCEAQPQPSTANNSAKPVSCDKVTISKQSASHSSTSGNSTFKKASSHIIKNALNNKPVTYLPQPSAEAQMTKYIIDIRFNVRMSVNEKSS